MYLRFTALRLLTLTLLLTCSACSTSTSTSTWQPKQGPLMTRWADDVDPDSVHPEYPRPQMVREDWVNLNGMWDYAIVAKDQARPQTWQGDILVPFPVESALSGVMQRVSPEQKLWYRRMFEAPDADGGRVLLHFGAVDWHAVVWVNGKQVGEHKGGYDPFSFDITDALRGDGEQELVIAVADPTDSWTQPRGKQSLEPKGIWYTPVTGIWQTVWLEPVPAAYIRGLKVVPDIDKGVVHVTVDAHDPHGLHRAHVRVKDPSEFLGGQVAYKSGEAGERITLPIGEDAKLWSPQSPFLYDLQVSLIPIKGAAAVDEVDSYFGMRKISLGKDANGFTVMMLNNKPLFQWGPLDQGWWPDGLYTAPTEEAMVYDLKVTQDMGFNMARKHVKTEPARWYYHCDKMGLLVWQDMPNGNLPEGEPNDLKISPTEPDADRPADSAKQWEHEWSEIIKDFGHFPSIVMWVPLNEGWGQYDTERLAKWTKELDPTRLVDCPSGWTDRGVGDVLDIHMYPGPGIEFTGPERAAVLGEYGGLGWPVEGHLWQAQKNWGYRTYQSREELQSNYERLMRALYGLRGHGLAGAIYTQTTDVEIEVNGLMTYDRAVVKFDPEEMTKLHERLYRHVPKAVVFAKDSEHEPQTWQYTTQKPAANWMQPGFDASKWKSGPAVISAGEPLGAPVRTTIDDKNIWARREFNVDKPLTNELYLRLFHQCETGTVYINGKPVAKLEGRTSRHFGDINISEHANVLKPGRNVIAVEVLGPPKMPVAIDVGVYGIATNKPAAKQREAAMLVPVN